VCRTPSAIRERVAVRGPAYGHLSQTLGCPLACAQGWSIGPFRRCVVRDWTWRSARDDSKTELMPILPAERDPRLITKRRGGTLTGEHHRLLAEWAALCAEHVLHLSSRSSRATPVRVTLSTRSFLNPRRGAHA
jgi:hypothetical protein